MTKKQFRAKVYEILEKHGSIEQNGTLYYPEPALMDLLEWFYELKSSKNKDEIDVEAEIAKTLDRAFKRMGWL